MMKLFTPKKLYTLLTNLTPARHFLVAYSGGLDSHVLLHSLAQLREIYPAISMRAIHFHHGLNTQADQWAEHCLSVCTDLGVDYQWEHLTLSPTKGESLENLARTARYQALDRVLALGPPDEVLLTGHHQNDQAETLLLQLLRGAGPKGLAAMPACLNFAHTKLIRPLLNFSRHHLEAYAQKHQLQWVEDSSNQELSFDRNFVRHELLPLIQKRWPSALTTLARSANHCAEASILLAQTADTELLRLQGSAPHTLSIQNLRDLSPYKQSLVIRRWFEHRHLPIPSQNKLMQIIHEILPCRDDAMPKVEWQGAEIRRYRGDLYAFSPLPPIPSSLIIPWDLKKVLTLPENLGVLIPQECQQSPLYKGGPVTVRFRQGGEYCKPVGSKMKRSLKNLFQEWGIPPWQRQRIPLLYQEEKIIQIPSYCVCTDDP